MPSSKLLWQDSGVNSPCCIQQSHGSSLLKPMFPQADPYGLWLFKIASKNTNIITGTFKPVVVRRGSNIFISTTRNNADNTMPGVEEAVRGGVQGIGL